MSFGSVSHKLHWNISTDTHVIAISSQGFILKKNHSTKLPYIFPPPQHIPFKTLTQFLTGFILEKKNWLDVPVCKEKLWVQLYISVRKDKKINLSIALHWFKKKSASNKK